MTEGVAARPPYRAALGAAAVVLAGYVLTLAPTVTFWDAGEFIAAAKILGIPHPPGTPLFVLVAHTWGLLVPVGEYAARLNLLSAVMSAAGAGLLFLVIHESLRGAAGEAADARTRVLRLGAAGAAAVASGFTFTHWQNSNETEVYSLATFTIAAMAWLGCRWRAGRRRERAPRLLLLVVYLLGLSVGNHLLALLAGPAVVAFVGSALLSEPAPDPATRRLEWARLAVLAGVWALLVGVGLGSTTLVVAGGACYLAAAAYAATAGAGGFAVAALAVAAVAVTPYLFLYLRSAQNPIINEAAPATFDALLAVLRRAQYPVRTPLDDPTVPHGPDNPGRSLAILAVQLGDYLTWFDWQWAKAVGGSAAGLPLRTLVTVLFVSLGVRGALAQRRADPAVFRMLAVLFAVTGLGLVLYMNFRPGFGRWYDLYPDAGAHEVRERDYFFVVSFIVWGLWAGVGLGSLALAAARRGRALAPAAAVLLLALLPAGLNWTAASRRHGPDARLAADFAYDLLNSAPPYGVLFTYGDNDTFPLWWAQEVEGIRRDVAVVCLALANTGWYMRQLRENPVRPLDRAALPAAWRDRVPARPPAWPLHAMTDSAIAAALRGYVAPTTQTVALGPVSRTVPAGEVLYPSDILALHAVQQNAGRRPVVWAVTAGREFAGLGRYVVQRGLGFELQTSPVDTTRPGLDLRRIAAAPLDVAGTERLVWGTYRYAGLLEEGAAGLESTSAGIASTLALPFAQLAYAYRARGDGAKLDRAAEYAIRLSPNPGMRAALAELRSGAGAAGVGAP